MANRDDGESPAGAVDGGRPGLDQGLANLVSSPARGLAYVRGGHSRRKDRYAEAGVPRPRLSSRTFVEVALDEATISTFRLARTLPGAAEWARYSDELTEALPLARATGWIDKPEGFHPKPPPAVGRVHRGRGPATGMEVLSFASDWKPQEGWPGAQRWASHTANATARVHLLRHSGGPRPWVVLLHGTSMGRPSDARVLRATRLHRELGVNVALPVLPLHGSRSSEGGELPCVDPMDQVHGLAQSAWDIRRVIGWIEEQTEATVPIGCYGVSLGGYLAALVASLDDRIACVVPIIPATDFPQLFLRAAPESYRSTPEIAMLTDSIAEIHRLVSPLALEPKPPMLGRLIIAGTADRLVDPVEQVAPLWEHWGRPDIHWFHGSHIGCMRRPSVWSRLLTVLADRGLAASQ